MKGVALIGQSGGPTSVINSSLAGIIQGCMASSRITGIAGMHYAIEGFLEGKVIDLGGLGQDTISALRHTPSSVLGSCRRKLRDEDLPEILERLKALDVRYLFLIGGNDTMDTVHRVEAYCKEHSYELFGVGIPKTVDNDLFGTDHTPGFASAARYVGLSVMQSGRLARDMQRVDPFVIHQTVGREAGWLAASSALARKKPGDAPHLIFMPERPLKKSSIVPMVTSIVREHGFCSIVCGEGILWDDGTPVSQASERDRFSNIEFGAMSGSSAALSLHSLIRNKTGMRGEFQITESLPMCAADRAVFLDVEEAYTCGRRAVELALAGTSGVMVSIERDSSNPYKAHFGTTPLSEVAVRAKPMPDAYIAESGHDVTQAFLDYASPLVGPMPEMADLDFRPFVKK